MPQELRVVRCFQCFKYQVDIVKKANKWACKLCGVKQSLAREFFRGTGKDCRNVVQQLSMRNLAIEQQEEEVVKLVLENKVQLPQPPVDAPPTPTAAVTERNERLQVPSKWESFLTKEPANDDPDESLSASESFESVSSTTFDRERINLAENSLMATGSSGWNKYRRARQDFQEDDAKSPSYNDKASRNSWVTEPKNSTYKPIGISGKAKQTTFSFQGAQKRDDSMELPSFHRKEKSNKRTIPNATAKFVSEANVAQSPSKSVAPGSVNFNPPAMPSKRKHTEVNATPPLMKFGKRSATETQSAPSDANESSRIINAAKSASSSSSKWAKYLQEDDETDENTDNNFIMF